MKLGRRIIFGGSFAAAATSLGAGLLSSSPLIVWLGWTLPVVFLTASAIWLAFVVLAVKRYRWLGAWTLLGAPFALVSPAVFLLFGYMCDWGHGPCI